ncbi:hypothetical protein CHS0354_017281 [Potamilus streckersoni]|uniref:Uncharacterized protein n=1 Tax=Potamilus streckersoni TaxID=2493646 RepID=A0AAE0SEX0_9BIVA|nr:hypothetical protein CHS0354_017281 [Potamilus streckersoni]
MIHSKLVYRENRADGNNRSQYIQKFLNGINIFNDEDEDEDADDHEKEEDHGDDEEKEGHLQQKRFRFLYLSHHHAPLSGEKIRASLRCKKNVECNELMCSITIRNKSCIN